MKEAELYGGETPFQIGRNRKLRERPKSYWVKCEQCGNEMAVSKITYIVVCSRCSNLCKIEDSE